CARRFSGSYPYFDNW
nr:immunoglobulin heavy chain junction region [Macaca mulatta]MOY24924.1 immunoglobulin heavy chain junction region [Macaca mulatta]MOY28985.1 immunoglobulin heavy chain junction region [Macaca mulatta]